MNAANSGHTPDVALGPLNENWKFFLAHLPFSAQPKDVRDYFSKFGSVNYVKLVYKNGKSKGYGFIYMNDANSDFAVESHAVANNNRISFQNKSDVFLARNDRKRQQPIRNPKKKSHDDGVAAQRSRNQYSNPNQNYMNSVPQDQNFQHQPHLQPSYSYNAPANYAPVVPNPQLPSFPYPPSHALPGPPAAHYSYPMPVPGAVYPGGAHDVPPPQQPPHQPPYHATPVSTNVFVENLPLTATPDDISACLGQYSLTVISPPEMEYDKDPKASWCYAHVQLATSEESSRCVALANQNLLEYRGRFLVASLETKLPAPVPVPVNASQHVHQQAPLPAPPPNPNMYRPPPVNGTYPRQHGPPRGSQGGPQGPSGHSPMPNNFRRGGGRGRHRNKRRDRPY